jgi:hypothetical protein
MSCDFFNDHMFTIFQFISEGLEKSIFHPVASAKTKSHSDSVAATILAKV